VPSIHWARFLHPPHEETLQHKTDPWPGETNVNMKTDGDAEKKKEGAFSTNSLVCTDTGEQAAPDLQVSPVVAWSWAGAHVAR